MLSICCLKWRMNRKNCAGCRYALRSAITTGSTLDAARSSAACRTACCGAAPTPAPTVKSSVCLWCQSHAESDAQKLVAMQMAVAFHEGNCPNIVDILPGAHGSI